MQQDSLSNEAVATAIIFSTIPAQNIEGQLFPCLTAQETARVVQTGRGYVWLQPLAFRAKREQNRASVYLVLFLDGVPDFLENCLGWANTHDFLNVKRIQEFRLGLLRLQLLTQRYRNRPLIEFQEATERFLEYFGAR